MQHVFGVAEHAISFVQLLGASIGVSFLADIRVVLADQLAVSLLDLIFAGRLGDPQRCVVILVFHVACSRNGNIASLTEFMVRSRLVSLDYLPS